MPIVISKYNFDPQAPILLGTAALGPRFEALSPCSDSTAPNPRVFPHHWALFPLILWITSGHSAWNRMRGDMAVKEAAAGEIYLPSPWKPQVLCTGWGFALAGSKSPSCAPPVHPVHWDSWTVGVPGREDSPVEPCIKGLAHF